MYIYFYIFFVSLIFCIFYRNAVSPSNVGLYKFKHEIYEYILFLLYSPFLLVAIFRFNVGTDYNVYSEDQIKYIISHSLLQSLIRFEPFFVFLATLSVKILGDVHWFFVLIACFTYFFLFKAYSFYCRNMTLVIIFFFTTTVFFISLNAMRQVAAFSVFLYSTQFIVRKKRLKYYFFILLAFFWHRSAIIYFFMYDLLELQLGKYSMFFILSFFLVPMLIKEYLTHFVSIPYIGYFIVTDDSSSFSTIIVSLIIFLIIARIKEKNIIDRFIFNYSLIIFCLSLGANKMPAGYRLVLTFWPLMPMLCERAIEKSGKWKYFIFSILITVFSIYFYRFQILSNYGEVIPYQTIFIRDNTNHPVYFY